MLDIGEYGNMKPKFVIFMICIYLVILLYTLRTIMSILHRLSYNQAYNEGSDQEYTV